MKRDKDGREHISYVSFIFWNVEGIFRLKNLHEEDLNRLEKHSFICLYETWELLDCPTKFYSLLCETPCQIDKLLSQIEFI